MSWRDLPATIAGDVAVTRTVFPGRGWRASDIDVHNELADFFRLVGRRHPDGRESILIRQSEPALVGLGVCDTAGGRWYLLNARAEPGLHGICQFSSTIQSTPSNYLRKHGGGATPHIDDFVQPDPTRIEHESWQFDLGDHYDRKVKLFRTVRFEKRVEVEKPLVWVHEDDAADLLRADYSTTGDLTVALTLAAQSPDVAADPTVAPEIFSRDGTRDVRLSELTNWVIDDDGIREVTSDQGVSFLAVTTRASTREVTEWDQPLMKPRNEATVTLPSAVIDGERRFAVEHVEQRGLAGNRLWSYPANSNRHGRTMAHRRVSAEGGRFWRHSMALAIADSTDARTHSSDWSWWNLTELEAAHSRGLTTTVELRLLTALLRASGAHRA